MTSIDLTKELQEVLKKEYGKDVTIEDASKILNDLTGYFDTLAKVYHQMQVKEKNAIIIVPD